MPRTLAKKPAISPITSDLLNSIPWLRHGFSTRLGGWSDVYSGGDLNLGFTKEDSPESVRRNRAAFLTALGHAKKPVRTAQETQSCKLITLRQIHSDIVHGVNATPPEPLAGDALITDTPGLLLGIQTADCLPIILADRKLKAVGVFHAGWRGTSARIIEKGVGEMRRQFGSLPRDVCAYIGPGIHSCCYQVGEEVREKFHSQFAYAEALFHETEDHDAVHQKYPLLFLTARAPGHSIMPKRITLDLIEANRRQLLDAGVLAKNVGCSDLCTSCRTDLLFSYRAENGRTGRLMAVAGIVQKTI